MEEENVWPYEKYRNDFWKITQTVFLIFIPVQVIKWENVDLKSNLT